MTCMDLVLDIYTIPRSGIPWRYNFWH